MQLLLLLLDRCSLLEPGPVLTSPKEDLNNWHKKYDKPACDEKSSQLFQASQEKMWKKFGDVMQQVKLSLVLWKRSFSAKSQTYGIKQMRSLTPMKLRPNLLILLGMFWLIWWIKSTFKVKNSLDKAIYLNRRWLPCFYMASVTDDVLFTTELTYDFLSSIDGKQTLIDRKWTCDLNCFFLCWRRVGCLFFDSLSCPPFGHNILCSPHTL